MKLMVFYNNTMACGGSYVQFPHIKSYSESYRKTSNTKRTKSKNLNNSLLVSQLSLPLKPGVKSRMEI